MIARSTGASVVAEALRRGGAGASGAPTKTELQAVASGNFADRFRAPLPDAIDPAAFAEMVARNTRTKPPEFLDPTAVAAAPRAAQPPRHPLLAPEWE